MHNEFNALLITHASAGAVMLLSGLGAIAGKKGQSLHRITGKTYAIATALVAITGFTIAVHTSNQFLIGTSIFVAYMMVSAYRSLYLKQLHRVKKAAPADIVILVAAAAASVYLLWMGAMGLSHGNTASVVPLVFGSICTSFVVRDIRKFVKGPADKKHWLYNHIAGMIGSYIAGVTAFLAVNAGYFTNDFSLLVWLGPTVIGAPYIIYQIRKYKVKKVAADALKVKIAVAAEPE